MPALTDTTIRHALKRVEISRKQENLADGEGRGTGRLVLVLAAGALIGVATGSAVGRIAGERRLQQSFAGLLVVVAAVTAAHQVGAGM